MTDPGLREADVTGKEDFQVDTLPQYAVNSYVERTITPR